MSVPTYPQATNRPLGRGTTQNYKINSGKENISKENLGKEFSMVSILYW